MGVPMIINGLIFDILIATIRKINESVTINLNELATYVSIIYLCANQ